MEDIRKKLENFLYDEFAEEFYDDYENEDDIAELIDTKSKKKVYIAS